MGPMIIQCQPVFGYIGILFLPSTSLRTTLLTIYRCPTRNLKTAQLLLCKMGHMINRRQPVFGYIGLLTLLGTLVHTALLTIYRRHNRNIETALLTL